MSAPIGHTCPDIDKIIKSIGVAIQDLRSAQEEIRRENYTDADSYIDSVIRDIEDYSMIKFNPLEDLRSSNSELREWGDGLESDIKSMQNYIDELESKINILNP